MHHGRYLAVFLVGCACRLLVAPVHAQPADPFISTFEKVKTAIAPVTCPHATGPRVIEFGAVHGTAFFINTQGVFLTAGHVIKGLLEGAKEKNCETAAVLVPANRPTLESLNLYALRFTPADCRVDESADLARCRTLEDPTDLAKIVPKPTALTIESDVEPDGTPVAFSGFPVNGLTPYTARANIAGYQGIEMRPNEGSQVHAIVLDKSAWPGASGGPVYGVDGRVMGMLLQTASGLAFARHGARIHDFLTAPNDRLQPPESP